MDDKDYQNWEKGVKAEEKVNQELLSEFEKWLQNKKLSSKTINYHVGNIDFYINHYLLYYDVTPATEGWQEISGFLGDFFIRKTTWASKYTVKENIASLKKFYNFLNEIGKLSDADLNEFWEIIKDEKESWLKEIETYWDDIDDD